MSGIAGIYCADDPRQATVPHIAAMLDAIRHRGPAGTTHWIDAERGIAIGRVAGDASPAHTKTAPARSLRDEDGIVAAFDGEATALVAAWRAGPDPFAHPLEDSFALCLWDARLRCLCLARDALATKPLYYHWQEATGLLVFASELKGVLAHPAVPEHIDPDGLNLFLTFGYIPAPHAIVAGVRKVFPGTALVFEADGRRRERRFWSIPPYRPRELSFDDAALETRERVLQRFDAQFAGAGRIGVYLSGGVDSTLALGILRHLGHRDLHSLTLGFARHDVVPRLREDMRWAQCAATRFRASHHPVVLRGDHDIEAGIAGLWRQLDEPLISPNVYTRHRLSEVASAAGATLCATGLGAEDVFGAMSPRKLAKIRARCGDGTDDVALMLQRYNRAFSFEEQRDLLRTPNPGAAEVARSALERFSAEIVAADLGDLMYMTTVRMMGGEKSIASCDRSSALNGVEVRHPFQDARLLRFARGIPQRFRGRHAGFSDKAVLVKAFADILPEEIAQRRKIGYPSYYWNRGELGRLRARLLSSEGLGRTGLFREDAVRRICAADDASPKKSAGKKVWGLLALQAWYEVHVNGDGDFLTAC